MYSFPNLEPVCCSKSGSNCCFLTGIQISQEAGKEVWYSHLLKNFPQFVVIHTINTFKIHTIWCSQWNRSRCFSGTLLLFWWSNRCWIWSLVTLPFINPAWTSGSSWFMYYWSLAWRILNITLNVLWHWLFFGIGMKSDLFPSCGHCWVFQICWQSEWSTLTASSFRIWNMEILSIPYFISFPSSLRLITSIFLEPASYTSQVVLILMPWTHPSCYPVFFH